MSKDRHVLEHALYAVSGIRLESKFNGMFGRRIWHAWRQVEEAEWDELRSVSFETAGSQSGLPLTERWLLATLHQVPDKPSGKREPFNSIAISLLLHVAIS